jgi:serine/threonine protein phosphatase 1
MRTYAIGDIHGMCDLLREALAWIAQDAGKEPCRVVFLGDYVDRGPSSREVVAILRKGAPAGQEWVCLKGNHEDLMQAAEEGGRYGRAAMHWLRNGGEQTLASYRTPAGQIDEAALAADVRWMSELRLRFEDEHRHYVHAGFQPGAPVERQLPEVMLWIRDAFLDSRFNFGKPVVHGHTPSDEPEVRPGRINLDTGACFWGRLTVARWLADEAVPHFQFFDTAARRLEDAA